MVKLFTIISKKDLAAVEGRQIKLSSVLRGEWEGGDGIHELMASPEVPRDSETVTIEVAFEAETDLSQYAFEDLDCPLAYKLPLALIDTGLIRAFSDQEILEVARETIRCNVVPSSKPLWRRIMNEPKNERKARYGPFLTKAFDELTLEEKEP